MSDNELKRIEEQLASEEVQALIVEQVFKVTNTFLAEFLICMVRAFEGFLGDRGDAILKHPEQPCGTIKEE